MIDVWFRQGVNISDELHNSVSQLTTSLGHYLEDEENVIFNADTHDAVAFSNLIEDQAAIAHLVSTLSVQLDDYYHQNTVAAVNLLTHSASMKGLISGLAFSEKAYKSTMLTPSIENGIKISESV
jgi:hypothetical protein